MFVIPPDRLEQYVSARYGQKVAPVTSRNQTAEDGRVEAPPERPKVHDWKSCVRATVPRVRIPPSPQKLTTARLIPRRSFESNIRTRGVDVNARDKSSISHKPPSHHVLCNCTSPLSDSPRCSFEHMFDRRQCQRVDRYGIPLPSPNWDRPRKAPSGKLRKRETFTTRHMFFDQFQHQASGTKRSLLWSKRRKSEGDQARVDECQAMSLTPSAYKTF